MTSPAPVPKPTASELEMLRLLWQLGPASARQVHEAALATRPEMGYANVLRQLQMMHTKGLLLRDESRRAHVYSPAQPHDTWQTSLIKDLINKAFAGSGKDLILAALRGHVSERERAEIQSILEREK